MNIYEIIVKTINDDQIKYNCPATVEINPKDYKELKGKTLEEMQKKAERYGLYVTINTFDVFADTHKLAFSLEPINPKNGFPITVTVD